MAEKEAAVDISLEQMFVIAELYPDAANSFLAPSIDLASAKETADIVLDANALLLPYNAGAESLAGIAGLFAKLTTAGRLVIPAQAAREFAKHRPRKLADLLQGFSDRISKFSIPSMPSYPILEGAAEYIALQDTFDKLKALDKEMKAAASNLLDLMKSWRLNDPVSAAYRNAITGDVIIECKEEQTTLRDELLHRYSLSIPPGYKDAGKDDGGIGDFVIWKTILQIGAEHKRPVIFVSGDEKADWVYSAGNVAIMPRYELVSEFARASGGNPFFIIPLSSLLRLYEGDSSSVTELQRAEERAIELRAGTKSLEDLGLTVSCPECGTTTSTELGEALGSSASPFCRTCFKQFHVNRSREGVVVRSMNHQPKPSRSEIEFCPSCEELVEFSLGLSPGSAKWIFCDACHAEFPTRRLKDGSVFVSRSFKSSSDPVT